MLLTTIICISAFLLFLYILKRVSFILDKKAEGIIYRRQQQLYCAESSSDKPLSAMEYSDGEHRWNPTFELEHRGVRVFNLPFVPEEKEVFYLENEYDEDANLFILENMDLIREMLATKGLTFVYLPYVTVSREMAEAMVAYHEPGLELGDKPMASLKSNFLLDYMVRRHNRPNIKHGLCWYNRSYMNHTGRKLYHDFDYITFDGAVARRNPRAVLEEMLPELGTHKIWREGLHSEVKIPSHGVADDNFNDEIKNLLEEVKEKLDTVRLKGISEAIIAQYIRPCPKLSRITISNSFRITMTDYDDCEIIMEPVVKAVFILFLRHEEGIRFKELADYRTELEIIYRAVKAKKNDIDERLASGVPPKICDSVMKLTDPMSNSINEKCTRIKEAFILNFHDSISMNYYVQGARSSNKLIRLPRKLVIWEGK